MASITRIAASTSAITQSGVKGMIAHAASAGATEMTGASRNNAFEEPVGIICSFMRSLIASAIGCSTHFQPRRFGLLRTCIQPITQRSTSW